MPEVIDSSLPCSQQSLAAGEPIHGSATADVHAWLLIEHRGRWEPDIADVELPAALRERIDAASARHRLRPQLIRRWDAEGPLEVLVVRTEPRPRSWRFRVQDHAELASIDFAALLSGDEDAGESDPPRDLYLVCTHGRRDKCCAMRGVAFFKSLTEIADGAELWQCSHLGGHRFAATMVYLPHAVSYGRLVPEDAEPLVAAHRAGRLYDLRRYRGQTRYSPALQTAEAWLREHEVDSSLAGPKLLGEETDGRRITARFSSGHQEHRVTLEAREGAILRMSSCGAEASSAPKWHYVVRHEASMVERRG